MELKDTDIDTPITVEKFKIERKSRESFAKTEPVSFLLTSNNWCGQDVSEETPVEQEISLGVSGNAVIQHCNFDHKILIRECFTIPSSDAVYLLNRIQKHFCFQEHGIVFDSGDWKLILTNSVDQSLCFASNLSYGGCDECSRISNEIRRLLKQTGLFTFDGNPDSTSPHE